MNNKCNRCENVAEIFRPSLDKTKRQLCKECALKIIVSIYNKITQMFEGENSSLKKTFDKACELVVEKCKIGNMENYIQRFRERFGGKFIRIGYQEEAEQFLIEERADLISKLLERGEGLKEQGAKDKDLILQERAYNKGIWDYQAKIKEFS